VGRAQKHLENQNVGKGDVFIFWGLFCDVSDSHGGWKFAGRPHHRIFGWLQVAEAVRVGAKRPDVLASHRWLEHHPHMRPGWSDDSNNTIYIAEERMTLWSDADLPGYGVLKRGFRLSVKGSPRKSEWAVPDWLHPSVGGTSFTYHPPHRWLPNGKLMCVRRGQEFVADVGAREDARLWLRALIEGAL
jgi:hypothetical protein